MTPEQIASDLVRAVLRATNSTEAEAACRAALRERDARWAEAIQSYVRHYGDIVDECAECAPLRALLEEAGK